jgi:inner membrane protein
MEDKTESLRNWLQGSAFLRVLFIGFVILLLLIPVLMIDNQIYERSSARQTAVIEVSSKWGNRQTVTGPRLVIPYYKIEHFKTSNGYETTRTKNYATFLPEQLQVTAKVKNETRYRGIYEIPLYQANIQLNGSFARPDFSHWNIEAKNILWDKAELLVAMSDARAIQKQVYLQWEQQKLAFEPGLGESNNKDPGFHVQLGSTPTSPATTFTVELQVNGSQSLYFAPMGKDSSIAIVSDWPDPSFQGYKLPTTRHVRQNGFSANWNISHISRNYPQQWLDDEYNQPKLEQSLVGVDFITPVDTYRMVERSIKYVILFLVLTFTLIWLIEIIARIRVHLLQYLFIGLGMCVFYLLLLALSEHIGFAWAYTIAGIAIVSMTSGYSKAVLKTTKRAGLVGGAVALLYLYLFSLLQEQNYSLLFGSIGLFVILAGIMYITRNIDWYQLRAGNK